MHHYHNCNYSHPKPYLYKDCWIEMFLEADFVRDRILYTASIELPNKKGVVSGEPKENREEAEFAAEDLIDSWN